MLKSIIILILVTTAWSRFSVLELNQTIPSAHMTSQGYHWREFESTTGPLFILTDPNTINCSEVKDRIVLTKVVAYIDEPIYELLSCGASGVAVIGISSAVPGGTISNFLNRISYSEHFPLVPVVDLADIAGKRLLANLTDGMTITLEWEENQWKNMSNTGGYYFSQIFNGLASIALLCLFMYLLIKLAVDRSRAHKIWIIICALCITACVIRIIGFVDFRSWRQLIDFKASLFFANMGSPFIFSPVWFLALVMLTILDRNRINNIILMKSHIWIYFLITGIFVASNLANTFVLTMSSDNKYIGLVSIIWVVITFGLTLSIAIIFTVAFARMNDAKIKSLKLTSRKAKRISRVFSLNFSIAICIFAYAILTITSFFVSSQPNSFLIVLIGLPIIETTILTLIAATVFISNPKLNPSTISTDSTKSSKHSRHNSTIINPVAPKDNSDTSLTLTEINVVSAQIDSATPKTEPEQSSSSSTDSK